MTRRTLALGVLTLALALAGFVACRTASPTPSSTIALVEAAVEEAADASTTTTVASADAGGMGTLHLPGTTADEDEAQAEDAGGPCPMPIHPGYCRRACRDFAQRALTMHARRVRAPVRAGTGTCGPYKVFAEDEHAGDGGVRSGIVEYFESSSGALVAAVDTRQACGKYGAIPKCTPIIAWGSGHPLGGTLGDVPDPFGGRK